MRDLQPFVVYYMLLTLPINLLSTLDFVPSLPFLFLFLNTSMPEALNIMDAFVPQTTPFFFPKTLVLFVQEVYSCEMTAKS